MKSLNIIGYDKYCVTNEGKIYSLFSKKILKESLRGDYLKVTLCNKEGHKDFSVHRLVAFAYHDNFEEGLVVNHKDGNKLNNKPQNLEWLTHRENTQHCWDELGRVKTPNANRTLSVEEVHEVCKMIEQGFRNKDIMLLHNVSSETISALKAERDYKEITKEYNFSRIPNRQRLSTDKILKICEKLQEGLTMMQIAKEVGVTVTSVRKIKRRETNVTFSEGFVW